MTIKKSFKYLIMALIIILFVVVFFYSKINTLDDNEILISYYYNGVAHDEAPSKGSYEVAFINCENATGAWDRYNWKLKLKSIKGKVSCNLFFSETNSYVEDVLPSAPELYTGLVPVTIDNDGTIKVADVTSEWYSYKNRKWANAVVVSNKSDFFDDSGILKTNKSGTVISMDNILQMYVWIPRYRYKLWNAENGVSDPQMIEVEFESIYDKKQEGTQNGQWLTHPSFTFGTTELSGIWVGKFEVSSTLYPTGVNNDSYTCSITQCTNTDTLRMKPNANSLRNISVNNQILLSRYAESYTFDRTKVDLHMMKSMDWGMVTYFTFSKYGRYIDENTCIDSGCFPWANPYYNESTNSTKTGCGGTIVKSSDWAVCKPWNDSTYGGNTSTTGNLYGIYDLAGGAWEYVAARAIDSTISSWAKLGLDYFMSKYFDVYAIENQTFDFYKALPLGDASKELLQTRIETNYCGNYSWGENWFCLGSYSARGGFAGGSITNAGSDDGEADEKGSWRMVLTIED